ncbi:sugar nucleotide-binding protein [Aquihabitans daechungensis]|uniref:SDR family oxidoreductase n=1 Tax=Aquihabitans daechungensis TaxID=1052257 RepID=UPI003B9DE97C
MRLVVTGSTGRLGRDVVAAARRDGHEVIGLARREARPCDLTDAAEVHRRFEAFRPDLVVHAAGATNVDGCERDPDLATRLNVDATRHVAEAAAAAGAHVLYLSTNQVFDGTADHPAREADPTRPLSVYGATKLAGEELVGPSATVVRTAWLSARTGGGVVASILDAAAAPGPLRFVVDEVAQPTFAHDLAPVLLRLGEGRTSGCFHATNEGPVSSFELAQEVLAAIGDDPERVLPIAAADLPGRIAARPRNGALDTRHLHEAGGGGSPTTSRRSARCCASAARRPDRPTAPRAVPASWGADVPTTVSTPPQRSLQELAHPWLISDTTARSRSSPAQEAASAGPTPSSSPSAAR